MDESDYLKEELYARVSTDPSIFEFLQSGSLDGLWYWDLEHPEHEWMNGRFWELLGYDPKEKKNLASEWQELINPDDLKVALENFKKHCEDPNHPYDQIVRYRHKNGKTVWVRCRGIAIRNQDGKPIRMLGAHNDLTELKELEERLRYMVSTDELTGLMNRRSFEEHFEWTLKNTQRSCEVLSLAMLDIDHFKDVNDTYGHQMGDTVLVAVATAIKQGCRENDFAARWGGEEFIVLLHGADTEQSVRVAERIRESVSKIGITESALSVSIGIATFFPEAIEVSSRFLEQCIMISDQALYRAKALGRNRVVHALKVDNGLSLTNSLK